jgi:hypothetical protein
VNHHLTNREIYQKLMRVAKDASRPLGEYLRALWRLGRAERDRETLPPDLFVGLVTQRPVLLFPLSTTRGVPRTSLFPAWRTASTPGNG